MENKELNMDEMSQVSGGSQKTIIVDGATVRSGPGKNYSRVGSLSAGQVVNFTGTVSYNDIEDTTWFLISSPAYGWVGKGVLA